MIHRSIGGTVGDTPLVELRTVAAGLPGRVVAKIESQNPGGSVKDRIGLSMIEDAEKRGLLLPGATVVEPTSGNTGIALALVAASKGYKLVVTMPDTMSRERVSLLKYLGAEVVLTPGKDLMRGAVLRAAALCKELPRAITLDQFNNPANPEVHRRTTAVEIWDATDGRVDVFVAGVGTGGTITGVGEVLKQRKSSVRVIAVEPSKCAVLSGGAPGYHTLQGIGAGFIPAILKRELIDEVLGIDEASAFTHARRLAREEGISAGISSGAALAAALQIAARPEMDGKLIVVMLPDSGERYLSTPLMDALLG